MTAKIIFLSTIVAAAALAGVIISALYFQQSMLDKKYLFDTNNVKRITMCI